MASEKDNVEGAAATEQLKYETCVLRVSIHCEGCKKKVKKVLQRIEGVYTTSVDMPLQRVTVTGNVAAELLVKNLSKVGKHAEIILPPENPPPAKDAAAAAAADKEKDPPTSGETPAAAAQEKTNPQENKEEPDNPEPQNSGEKKKKKKKNKKKEKKDDSVEGEGEIKENSSLQGELFSRFPPPVQAVSYGAVFYEQPTQRFILSPLPLYRWDELAIPSYDEENAGICRVM